MGLAAALACAVSTAAALVPGPSIPSMPSMPGLPGSSAAAGTAPANPFADEVRIPLESGLVVTRLRRTSDGDEESQVRVSAADAAAQSFNGTTAFSLSARLLRELKDSGSGVLTLDVGGMAQGAGVEGTGVDDELDAMFEELGGFQGIEEAVRRQAERGTLTEGEQAQGAQTVQDIRRLGLATGRLRVTGTQALPVIVNDRVVRLRAISAVGSLSDGQRDVPVALAVLDDPANPLLLQLDIDGEMRQVVRLAYAQSSRIYAAQIEQALVQRCRVDVYGLAFAPGAATLGPGADETLAALRTALARHADWTLAVLSHGDAGTSASLSQRRATAIQAALSAEAGPRLVAIALPKPAPLSAEDTIAGRALNRRATLSRTGCRR